MVWRKLGIYVLLLSVMLFSYHGCRYKEQTFKIEIKNRKAKIPMEVFRVKQGEMVTFWCTSDETATIHLHGYNIEQVVKPERPTVFTFKSYATGRYPITAHSFGKLAPGKTKEEKPLVYLEVLP
ncbi:MAG: hypothetical protein ACE5DO_08535 [Desulfobacterales bacterium]